MNFFAPMLKTCNAYHVPRDGGAGCGTEPRASVSPGLLLGTRTPRTAPC